MYAMPLAEVRPTR